MVLSSIQDYETTAFTSSESGIANRSLVTSYPKGKQSDSQPGEGFTTGNSTPLSMTSEDHLSSNLVKTLMMKRF
jgi:hypothetical protein